MEETTYLGAMLKTRQWNLVAIVFIFVAHNVKVIQCHSIEGRPTDGFGCLTVCKRASSHNYFEFGYLVWHTISFHEWPFENIFQLPHPFIFSHLIITCLFSDNKSPILVERQVLCLIIKLYAVKMLFRAGFEPAT